MEIWLVRHGETNWNRACRVQGWTDIPLNKTGQEQAYRLGASLEGVPFKHIYASDLSRAYDTAKAIARFTNAPITTHQALREQYYGQAEGLLRTEKERRFPNGAPDAETHEDVQKRIALFLDQVKKQHPSGRVVIATHGGVVRAALALYQQPGDSIHNTSVSCLKVEGDAVTWLCVNATPHLQPASELDSPAAGVS